MVMVRTNEIEQIVQSWEYANKHNIDQTVELYKAALKLIADDSLLNDDARVAMVKLMDYILDHRWGGGLQSITAVLYVLLSECKLHPMMCVGRLVLPGERVAHIHSWVTLDDKIYDLSCGMFVAYGARCFAPVIAGMDATTHEPPVQCYGVGRILQLDRATTTFMRQPFISFMDGYPGLRNGLWDVVRACLPVSRSAKTLRSHYMHVSRRYVETDEDPGVVMLTGRRS